MTASNAPPSKAHSGKAQTAFGRIPAVLGGKYFNRLRIGGKLTIGFGILGALTLLVIGLSYLGSYRATLNINRTGDVRVPTALASARAQANLLRMQADVQAYLALGDKSYRESYQQAKQAFESDLAELEQLAGRHETSSSNTAFDRRLDDLKSAYTQWSALPEQLIDLRDDQLKREPALRLLIEDANPLIVPILVDISGMIAAQQQRNPSPENMALLGDMANFQASFFAMVAGLRGYVTTGRDSFQYEYTSNLTVNDSAWEGLVNEQARLESTQRDKLHHISQARETFLALPPQMFEAVRGEHAREDLFLFRTQAVPLAETSLQLLDELTADEQNLLQSDLSEGREQLALAQRQTLASGVVAFFLGLALAFVFRENIAGPVRRLTQVAEQIGAGNLAARAAVESGDEIGTLAQTFNQMTGRLSETLDDLEQRRSDLQATAETLSRQNEYLAALQETSLGLLSRLDLNELLESLVTRAGHLLGAPHGLIYLVEPEAGILERKVGVGVFSQELGFQVKSGEGLAGRVWQSGQPLVIDDYDTWPGRLSDFGVGIIGAIMGAPLTQGVGTETVSPEVVGVIGMAYDAGSSRTFGEAEVELLSRFAQLASVALDNARLFEETRRLLEVTQQRSAELAIINSVGEAMARNLDVQTVTHIVGDKVREIFQAEVTDILLLDPQTNLIHQPYCYYGTYQPDEPFPLGEGLTSVVIQSRQPLILDSWQAQVERGVFYNETDGFHRTKSYQTESYMGVPIIVGDKVLGVVSVQSYQQHSYDENSLRLLSTLSANTGVAIENARLFQAERAQAGRQAALFRLSAAIAAALDEDEICRRVVEGLQDEALGYAYVAAFLVDPATGERVERAKVGWSDSNVPIRLGSGQGLSEKPLLDGQLHYTPDVAQAPGYVATLSSGSEVDVPLKIGQEVIGVLVVESRQPNAFGQDDLDVITAAANQAGVALGRARLLQETRKAREAAEAATHELSQALENLKATQRQLVEAEKMAALGGLVAGVAHEINTPVGIGVTAASLLEDKTTAFREIYQNGQMKRSDLEKYLDTASQSSTMILNNLYRAAELIQSFKQVAVDQSSEERRSFKVRQYLEEILLSLRPKLKRTQHRINIEGTDDLVLDSYPGAFSQIVTNLVMNSLIHAYGPDEAGQLTFDLKQKNKRLVFEYGDDDRGISKEHLNKIFDPFFTTKRGHGGSGLGLHIIYNLVTQKLEGTIRCESEVGSGTRFVIDLPLERSTSNGN
jgi:GAF domain-containing protein/signal transduction histidine kinase